MSLGLLDDDNPWNDPLIPPITTPDTGHAPAADVAAAVHNGEDGVNEYPDAAYDGLPNGYVAGAKPVANAGAPFELDTPNGQPPNAAAGAAGSNDDAPSARPASASGAWQHGYEAGADAVANDAAPLKSKQSNGHALEGPNGWPPAPSPLASAGSSSRRPSATASTSSSSPSPRLHRSMSNASSKPRPAGWTTPAPATIQRSASRASTSSARRPSGGAGAADVSVKTSSASVSPAADGWTSAPRLHRSSSSASSRGAPNGSAALLPALGDAWASATSLHRASSTSSSATAARPLFSTPPPSSTSTPPPQAQLRRRKGGPGPGTGHARAQTIDVTHDAHPLSQPPSPAASPPPSPPARVTHLVARSDSLAGVALRYGVTVAALRRANGLWANDSIHLRTALVIPDGKGDPLPPPPKTMHVRARTSVEQVQGRRSFENGGTVRARTSTELPSAADVAVSFSLTLPRLRLSLDRDAPSESDAEHELLPLSLSARRRKSRPQLSMTTKQPSPIRGMVLPRPSGDE